jgi:hypothetical protein
LEKCAVVSTCAVVSGSRARLPLSPKPPRFYFGRRKICAPFRRVEDAMSAVTEGLDTFLADRRIAIGALLANMHAADLVRACSGNVSEAEVAVAIERHTILRLGERTEASP